MNTRVPIWCCSGWRLPRFTSLRPEGLNYSSLWPYSSPWVGISSHLLRTAVSRHPSLRSPDLPLLTMSAATARPTSQFDDTRGLEEQIPVAKPGPHTASAEPGQLPKAQAYGPRD